MTKEQNDYLAKIRKEFFVRKLGIVNNDSSVECVNMLNAIKGDNRISTGDYIYWERVPGRVEERTHSLSGISLNLISDITKRYKLLGTSNNYTYHYNALLKEVGQYNYSIYIDTSDPGHLDIIKKICHDLNIYGRTAILGDIITFTNSKNKESKSINLTDLCNKYLKMENSNNHVPFNLSSRLGNFKEYLWNNDACVLIDGYSDSLNELFMDIFIASDSLNPTNLHDNYFLYEDDSFDVLVPGSNTTVIPLSQVYDALYNSNLEVEDFVFKPFDIRDDVKVSDDGVLWKDGYKYLATIPEECEDKYVVYNRFNSCSEWKFIKHLN